MSNRLEKFVRDNREHFDDAEPASHVWEQLQRQLQPAQPTGKLRTLRFIRWSVAAALVIVCGTIAYFGWRGNSNHTAPQVATNSLPDSGDHAGPRQQDLLKEINPDYAEEVYHFTRLIELKQSELKQIEKDDPALYRKFVHEINRLDSSYKELKNELPDNPNREQLLEAMIQNLKLQTELLNQQLTIIQKIKQAKNPNHESNSKSI